MMVYSDERLLAEIALAGILAGKYKEAEVHLLSGSCSSSLLPFKALSEYHLGLNHNLKKTIKILKSDGNNELTVFAEQFEKDLFL